VEVRGTHKDPTTGALGDTHALSRARLCAVGDACQPKLFICRLAWEGTGWAPAVNEIYGLLAGLLPSVTPIFSDIFVSFHHIR
jgi:hypothetical protein